MKLKTLAWRIVPLLYFLAVSLPHHPFSDWFDKNVLDPWGHDGVQQLADILSAAFLILTVALAIRVARVHRGQAVKHFGVGLVLLALMFAADRYLIVNNIERVHFPQYAVLALLLGLSLRGEILIFFVTTFAGFVDEFLQYVMDPMKTNYLDFNDIVFNLLGAAAGVVLLMGIRKPMPGTAGINSNRKDRQEYAKKETGIGLSIYKKPLRSCLSRTFLVRGRPLRFAFSPAPSVPSRYESIFGNVFQISMAVGGVVLLLAGSLGRIVLLLEQKIDRSVFAVVDGKLSFIMSFERHDEFWMKSYFGKVFHVMSAGEGVLAVTVLCLGAWVVVRWLRR